MMKPWLVRLENGHVKGPYSEAQIRKGLQCGRITDAMQIRQQLSPWTPAPMVRQLFEKLAQQGFYLKTEHGQILGPFTKPRILELESARELPSAYWIRQGKQGQWKPIHGPREKALSPPPVPLESNLATAAQLPLCIPAAPVMKLRRPWYVLLAIRARQTIAPLPPPLAKELVSSWRSLE
jgi:hypothetical protein